MDPGFDHLYLIAFNILLVKQSIWVWQNRSEVLNSQREDKIRDTYSISQNLYAS